MYIDSAASNAAGELQKWGGARLIVATAPDSKSMSDLVAGLAPNGKLLVVGAPSEPLSVNGLALLSNRQTVQGWASGTGKDSEDTLEFSAYTGVRPMIETFPLTKVAEAYDRMMTGKVRFRAVLTM